MKRIRLSLVLFLVFFTGAAINASNEITFVENMMPVPSPPTITSHPQNQNVCSGGMALFSVGVSGDEPLTYQWQKDGVNLSSATGTTLQIYNVSSTDIGSYRCIATNPNGSATSNYATLSVYEIQLSATITDVSCAFGSDGEIAATASGGIAPYTYSWSSGQPTATISNLTAGNYWLNVYDFNGCYASQSYGVYEPQELMVTINQTYTGCEGDSSSCAAVIVSGGIPPYNYQWSSGQSTSSICGLSAGNYTVTVYDFYGCQSINNFSIIEHNNPHVWIGPATNSVCLNGNFVDITTSPSGGVLTGNGISGTDFFPLIAGVGNHLIQYEYTDQNGCVGTDSQTIVVHPIPNVSLSAPYTAVCHNDDNVPLTVNPSGGWFDGQGVWGNDFVPFHVSPGTYNIQYTYNDHNGCQGKDTITMTVLPVPNVSLTLTADVCVDADSIELFGSPSGGSYSGTAVSGNYFRPLVSGNGYFDIKYVYTDHNGCSDSTQSAISVHDLPNVNFWPSQQNICLGQTDSVFLDGSPHGGTFSGTGVSGQFFLADVAGPGVHFIDYTYTDHIGCTSVFTDSITVNVPPIVSISSAADSVCHNSSAVPLTANPTGGWFQGYNVWNDSFDPWGLQSGDYSIVYEYIDVNGCYGSDTTSIHIYPEPVMSIIMSVDSVCQKMGDTVHLSGIPSGGSFSGWGVSGNMFIPEHTGSGYHQIDYSAVDMNGCTATVTSYINVLHQEYVSLYPQTHYLCENNNSIYLSPYPYGGVYTGVGISNDHFNPHTAGDGVHPISYTYTEGNGCHSTVYDTITVYPNPVVSLTTSVPHACNNSTSVLLSGNPSGGWFNGPAVIYNYFHPNLSGPGNHELHYTYHDHNGCEGHTSIFFDVFNSPNVYLGPMPPVCANSGSVPLTGGQPAGGTYTNLWGHGVSNNILYVDSIGPGTFPIQYTYSDTNGCTNSSTNLMTINHLTSTGFYGLPAIICVSEPPVQLMPFPGGGTFSGTGVWGYSFDPSAAGIGNHAVIYTHTDMNMCINADTQYVQVTAAPVVTLGSFPSVCENSPPLALSGGSPAGGYYYGNAAGNGFFYPAFAGPGTHTIYYRYNDVSGCYGIDSSQITVTPQPTSSFTTNSPICYGDTMTITYNGSASAAANYTWDFGGGTVVSGSGQGPYSIIWPTSGVKQLSLTVSENGCTSQSTSTLVIVHSNDAFISAAGGTSFCQGDSLLLVANAGSGLTYQWYRNDTLIPGAVQNLYYAHSSGNFSVEVGTSYGCFARSNQVTTSLFPIPQPTFSLPAMACANDTITITYTGNASSGAIYNWGLDNGQTSGSGQGPLDVVWSSPGPKLVTLQVSENGCQSQMHSQQIMINTTPATATAPGNTTFCNGQSVTLFANSGANLTYQWLRDGNPITGATQSFYTANQTGNYSVVVTNSATTCAAESNQIPVMVNTTNFNLAFTASSTSLTSPPFLVAFSNQTPNTANYYYTWDFGDGNTSSFSEPFHQYLYDGTYTVTLYAQNIFTGCRDTLKKTNYITCSGGTPNPCTITAIINQGGSAVMCPGDSMLVTANVSGAQGPVSYQWFIDGVLQPDKTTASFMTMVNGLYRVIVTDTVCSFTSSAFIIAYYPVVKPSILSFDSLTPCSNDSMMLQVATYYSSYLWSTGATTPEIYVSQSGHYFVTATDANGCKQVSDPFVVNASLLQPPPICIVGVDSNNFNTVVWERPITNLIDSFYVYRETTVANVYQRIGGLSYNDFSAFVDSAANPAQRSWRYRLTAIDTCGMESPFSPIHKTIHLTINKGLPGTWNLIWDGYQGFNFGSYNIYRGTDSTNMSLLTQIQSNLNSYTDLNPPSDTVFYQIEVVNPFGCNPSKAMNYNSSRSNQASTMAYIIPDTTGISQIRDAGFSMNVYPNPNSGNFTVSIYSPKANTMEMVLLNTLGQALHSERIDVSGRINHEMEVSHMPKGVYFLRVSTNDGSRVMKVILR